MQRDTLRNAPSQGRYCKARPFRATRRLSRLHGLHGFPEDRILCERSVIMDKRLCTQATTFFAFLVLALPYAACGDDGGRVVAISGVSLNRITPNLGVGCVRA